VDDAKESGLTDLSVGRKAGAQSSTLVKAIEKRWTNKAIRK